MQDECNIQPINHTSCVQVRESFHKSIVVTTGRVHHFHNYRQREIEIERERETERERERERAREREREREKEERDRDRQRDSRQDLNEEFIDLENYYLLSTLPMVTSKSGLSFLTQVLVLSNKSDLRAWKMVVITSSSMVVIDLA